MFMLAETMRHTWHQGGDLGDTRGWGPLRNFRWKGWSCQYTQQFQKYL